MSYFKAKMHQIQFQLGLHLDPAGGAYSAKYLAVFLLSSFESFWILNGTGYHNRIVYLLTRDIKLQ